MRFFTVEYVNAVGDVSQEVVEAQSEESALKKIRDRHGRGSAPEVIELHHEPKGD